MTIDLRIGALTALALIALAGCGSKEDKVVAENESVEEVAAKVAKADLRPTPGRYEVKLTLQKMEMPGMPKEVQSMMKQQVGKVQTSMSCLTKEEADKADGEFFKPKNESGCKYKKFEMGGGTIEADMTCEQSGMTQNMRMSGTYGKEAYAMTMDAEGKMQGQSMAMTMAVEANRVGECDGKEES